MVSTNRLYDGFIRAFPGEAQPVGCCRCPGRINLLGEHLDYNGLPVLPITIQHEIRAAYGRRADNLVVLRNARSEFLGVSFENARVIPPSPTGAWENYCKAAIQALNDRFPDIGFPGMNVFVEGSIPLAAGLSSSSALVVLCALAYLRLAGIVLEKDISRLELATLCAEGEHYVGTRGGGMDQAVILFGEPHFACKIDFFPLRVEHVPLFDDYVFVAAHSLVKADKTGNALHRYNMGPTLCRLLTVVLERAAKREYGDEVCIERLGDLWYGPLCLTYGEAQDLFAKSICQESFSLEEIASLLELPKETITRRWLGSLPVPSTGFRLRARARHVVGEFQRVESGRDLLQSNDPYGFGELMNASHESCAKDYEVSCPELDELVSIARDAGALGARMTGAGFGGYTVSLISKHDVDRFTSVLYERYYAKRGVPAGRVSEVLWVVEPSACADYM